MRLDISHQREQEGSQNWFNHIKYRRQKKMVDRQNREKSKINDD